MKMPDEELRSSTIYNIMTQYLSQIIETLMNKHVLLHIGILSPMDVLTLD
jgi:hypothetical protein